MSGPFEGVVVPPPEPARVKRRYSVTADIVGFRRCPRQYGAFRVHNYAPAHQTQLYYGTIVHQVLDRCHAHYQGLFDPATRGQLPDEGRVLTGADIEGYFDAVRDAEEAGEPPPLPPTDIIRYFLAVEDGLKSHGIRAVTPDLRFKAIRVLQHFNALEGPELYRRVKDTEYRLQADQSSHIVHGVVDLLLQSTEDPNDPAEYEIWDYKGKRRDNLSEDEFDTYQFQMRVYARLYEIKNGVRPRRAVLYFVNELDEEPCPTVRPATALLPVSLESSEIDQAVEEFTQTVLRIEAARASGEWNPADPDEISEQDCAICDLRWDCPTPNHGRGVALRYP